MADDDFYTNEQGQICKTDKDNVNWKFMVWSQPLDTNVFLNGHGYHFSTNVVSGAWVMESDSGEVANMKRMCCGGRLRQDFYFGNQAQFNVWRGYMP